MPKYITKEEFTALLNPGMKLFVQGCTVEPHALLEALEENPQACDGVEFVGVPLPDTTASIRPDFTLTRG